MIADTRVICSFEYRGYNVSIVREKGRLFYAFEKTGKVGMMGPMVLDEGAIDLTKIIDDKLGFPARGIGAEVKLK